MKFQKKKTNKVKGNAFIHENQLGSLLYLLNVIRDLVGLGDIVHFTIMCRARTDASH